MALTDAVARQAKITGKDYTLTDADTWTGCRNVTTGRGSRAW